MVIGKHDERSGAESGFSGLRGGRVTWLAQAILLTFLPPSSFSVALKNKQVVRKGEWCDLVVVERKTKSQGLLAEVWTLAGP